MKRQALSDWHWLSRGSKTHYTCPLLMTLSLYGWRLSGRECHWYAKPDRGAMVFVTGHPNAKSFWEAPCLFPRKAILIECWIRNQWAMRYWLLNCLVLKITGQRYALKQFTTS